MKAEQAKFLSSITPSEDDGMESAPDKSNSDGAREPEECAQDVCSLCHDASSSSPVSYLILLQVSNICSF